MSGQPGANSRGRGGKFRKFTRGGGKHYSRDLRPLDADGNPISMWSDDAQKQFAQDESEEDSDEDSDDSDEAGGPSQVADSREDRRNAKKARKEAALARRAAQEVQVGDLPPSDSEEDSDEDDMPANPNHSRASRNQARGTPLSSEEVAAEGVKNLSLANRRERESIEAQQAKERYQKLHEQGKTDEAKADMARLKLIREQREAESARRKAEKEEKEMHEAARKAELDAKRAAAQKGPKKSK